LLGQVLSTGLYVPPMLGTLGVPEPLDSSMLLVLVLESTPRGGVNRRSLLKICTQELSLRLPGGSSAGSVRWALPTSARRSRVRNATSIEK
jgi:hypothetical protein